MNKAKKTKKENQKELTILKGMIPANDFDICRLISHNRLNNQISLYKGISIKNNVPIKGLLYFDEKHKKAYILPNRKDIIQHYDWSPYEIDISTCQFFFGLTDCKGQNLYTGDNVRVTLVDKENNQHNKLGTIKYSNKCFIYYIELNDDCRPVLLHGDSTYTIRKIERKEYDNE